MREAGVLGHPSRAALECFIATRYAAAHGAVLRHFMPRLFALVDPRGELLAAFGLRGAQHEPLFLERYLDAPAEALIAGATGRCCARSGIVEIGNLAGATPGALRVLIPALARHLRDAGHDWVMFTAPAALANAFARLALPLSPIAEARQDRLPDHERRDWGRYYAQCPKVWLGDVRGGCARLDAGGDARISLFVPPTELP